MPVAPEHRLTDEAETLLRQVHPAFVVEGRVASAAFRPSSQDEGELSVPPTPPTPPTPIPPTPDNGGRSAGPVIIIIVVMLVVLGLAFLIYKRYQENRLVERIA